MYIDNN